MDRKMYLLILLLACRLVTVAQITVQSFTLPSVGDTLRTATDNLPSGISPGGPGENLTWDFSSLQAPFINAVTLLHPSQGANSAAFPNASFVTKPSAESELYYRTTTTQLLQIGFAGDAPGGLGIPVLARYSPPLQEKKVPLQYGDAYISTAGLLIPVSASLLPDTLLNLFPIRPDSIRLNVQSEINSSVDAWGKLSIPSGTFEVLREKKTVINLRKVEVKSNSIPAWIDVTSFIPFPELVAPDTVLTYEYWSNVAKEPIAVVRVDASGSLVSVDFKADDNTISTTFNGQVKGGNIFAYPNPAIGSVRFDITGLSSGVYTVKLYNILGVAIWSEKINVQNTKTLRLDLDDFKRGTYLYSLVNDKGRTLVTKRLVVMRP